VVFGGGGFWEGGSLQRKGKLPEEGKKTRADGFEEGRWSSGEMFITPTPEKNGSMKKKRGKSRYLAELGKKNAELEIEKKGESATPRPSEKSSSAEKKKTTARKKREVLWIVGGKGHYHNFWEKGEVRTYL